MSVSAVQFGVLNRHSVFCYRLAALFLCALGDLATPYATGPQIDEVDCL